VDIKHIARESEGFFGAELEQIIVSAHQDEIKCHISMGYAG